MKKISYYILIFFFTFIISCNVTEDIALDSAPNTDPLKIVSFKIDGLDIETKPTVSLQPTAIIEFNNEVNIASLDTDFQFVSPKLYYMNWKINIYENDPKKIMIYGGLLEANTTYEIFLDNGITDIYGSNLKDTKKRFFKTSDIGMEFGRLPDGEFNNFVAIKWPNPNYYLYGKKISDEIFQKVKEYRVYFKRTQTNDIDIYGSYIEAAKDIPVFGTDFSDKTALLYFTNFILFKNDLDESNFNPNEEKSVISQNFEVSDKVMPLQADPLDITKGFVPYNNGEIYRAWGFKVQILLQDGIYEKVFDRTYNYYITVRMMTSTLEPKEMYKQSTSLRVFQAINPETLYNPYFYKVYEGGFF